MSLSDYLAKNYLGSDKQKKEKKRVSEKREHSLIVDDQPFGASSSKKVKTKRESAAVPTKITSESVPKSSGKKGWKVVGTNEAVEIPKDETADKNKVDMPKMASGANAGLQTGSQISEQLRAKQDAERKEQENLEANNETVYRDRSGRRVNFHQIREEEKLKQKKEELLKEKRKKEMNMGLVQKLMLEKSKAELLKAKDSSLSRYANDKDLNEDLKRKEHDDDPLLSFRPSSSKKHVSLTGRKLYRGGFPENRFGIAPGHRWDGVDRSNGFEAKWFKKQVEKERAKTLSYTMQEEY